MAWALAWCAAATAAELTWQPRILRAPAPRGYLAVVGLRAAEGTLPQAALACEGVELRAGGGRWEVVANGTTARQGALAPDGPTGFLVKRTPTSLMLGVDGCWVYGRDVGPAQGAPEVRVGVAAGCEVESLRLVAREPVRFADDFPDPEPATGRWTAVRGQWALSSLSFPDQSANPAELAAVFDEIEDEASRGRTRQRYVGVGIQLGQGRYARVVRLAGDSPAARAGLKQNDWIRKVDGVDVRSAEQATALLDGEEGTTVKVTVEQDGKLREVELTRELVVWGKTRRQVPLEPYRADDQALIVTGFDFWTDYPFRCAAQTRGVGAFGLVFAYLGPQDYHAFRWVSADRVRDGYGCWQVVRVRRGQEQVVAERQGGFLPNDFYAMSVRIEGDRPGEVRATCAIDSMTVLEAADDAIVPGKLGFWAAAPGAVCFDDVAVGLHEPNHDPGDGTANTDQRYDPVMRAWADPVRAWVYVGLGQQWWHTADFPGDVALSAPVDASLATGLVIAADRPKEDSGYALELPQGAKVARLSRAGKLVHEKLLDGRPPKKAILARHGNCVRVLLDDKPCLTYDDPAPLRGSSIHVKGVLVRDVKIHCPNAVEDYFNGMPTPWHVMHGHWEVMNRWVCDPRWSFFGGRDDHVLAIWSKRSMEGDCFLDFHMGLMMFERSGRYENMRDIGFTLCGDGANLASGYTAIVGADSNRRTALFRNGRCVAHTSSRHALLPDRGTDGRGGQLYSQHRGWVHLKLLKRGSRVELYVWDKLVLDYDDPDPLPGGRAAIWSVENGLLLGKVRLAATRLGQPEPFLRQDRPFADACLTNEGVLGRTRVVAHNPAYEITNTVGGGPFALALRPRVFSAFERGKLSFDVKLAPDVQVDLYFRSHGQLYRVVLSGPAASDGSAPGETLGAFEGAVPDGQWHRVSFDLLAALRQRHPTDQLLMVYGPELANYSNQYYLLAGFGANGAGATYWLRDIRLESSGDGQQVSRAPASQ